MELRIEYLAHSQNELTVKMLGSNGFWCEVRICVYKRRNGKWQWWAHDDPPSIAYKRDIQNALNELYINCKGFTILK